MSLIVLCMTLTVHARGIGKKDDEKVCPFNSSGDYPNCICNSGSQFNRVHDICPPESLESYAGSCPDNSTGKVQIQRVNSTFYCWMIEAEAKSKSKSNQHNSVGCSNAYMINIQ